MKNLISIIVIIFLFFISSCTNDEECRKNRYVNMGVGIYHVTFNATTEMFVKSILSIDSLTLQGLKYDSVIQQNALVDSILYNNSKIVNKLVLPLDKSSNQSEFLVKFNDISDTITILHTNFDYYLSLECGCIKTFSLDTVLTTNHFIDSVRITNHNVNNIDAEHLQIYN